MGRYPFRAGIPHFIEARSPYCTTTTIAEDARKLRYFARVFEGLRAEGKAGTTDPRHMGRREVEAFLTWMKARGLSSSTRAKYLKILDHYLTSWGNRTISDLRLDRTITLPRGHEAPPIRALTVEELQRILDATYSMQGWRGQAVRGLIALGFGTGCRPKEILNAETADIDLRRARFYVRHPKGEGTWGVPQWIPIIRKDMLPFLEELVTARGRLEGPGTGSRHLFPSVDPRRPISGNTMRMYKAETERITGIKWAIKDLRSTFASVTVAGDVARLKAVSLQLRHSSVKNTEKYYAKINTEQEIEATLGDVWREHPIVRN